MINENLNKNFKPLKTLFIAGNSWKPNLEENIQKVTKAHNSIYNDKELEISTTGTYKF